MSRKKVDPRFVNLLDERERTLEACERWYSKLKRAFTALEQHRARLKRIDKRIAQMKTENPA